MDTFVSFMKKYVSLIVLSFVNISVSSMNSFGPSSNSLESFVNRLIVFVE